GGLGATGAHLGEQMGRGGGLRLGRGGGRAVQPGRAIPVVFERGGLKLARGRIEAAGGQRGLGTQPTAAAGQGAARGIGQHPHHRLQGGGGGAAAQEFDPGQALGQQRVVGGGGFGVGDGEAGERLLPAAEQKAEQAAGAARGAQLGRAGGGALEAPARPSAGGGGEHLGLKILAVVGTGWCRGGGGAVEHDAGGAGME